MFALESSFLLLVAQVPDLLPVELRLIATEMPATRCLLEPSLSELQIPHDHSRSQVEVPEDNALQVLITES